MFIASFRHRGCLLVPLILLLSICLLSWHHRSNPDSISHRRLQRKNNLRSRLWSQQRREGVYLNDKSIFFYHARKAGGTSVEKALKLIGAYYNYDVLITEGITLDHRFLDLARSISVISLRHPIDRIVSLYWYEHVMWWYGPGKNPSKCRTFSEWVNAWRDGTPWKERILLANPDTTYVEVENYFIKNLLGGSVRQSSIGEPELEQAKKILDKFDIVLLTKWMNDKRQISYMKSLFPKLPEESFSQHLTESDRTLISKLESDLAADKVDLYELYALYIPNFH